ncbi:MAG: tRNA pseudouridine(55) synthase TruB [Cyclobacteriaceae bacterium]|nr:tRNA pseudouridine(55) synthase TruB [Cyclobacteriaceae bacterium]
MSEKDPAHILLVNKAREWTSFDVVKKIRGALRIKKVGHAGTLDPLATGLLIVCTGSTTKQIQSIVDAEKEYTGTMVLGQTRPSVDLETEVESEQPISHLNALDVKQAFESYKGEIMQIPPLYSAIKVGGTRAYKHARAGNEDIQLEARKVQVYESEITNLQWPRVEFRIVCSKGFYIRSWVRDIGETLGVGAYMESLCRTRIGKFRLQDAGDVHEIVESLKKQKSHIG